MGEIIDTAWKHEVMDRSPSPIKPCREALACFGYDLELHGTPSLLLDDRRAITKYTCTHQVTNPDLDQITAAQFAVDGQIE